MSPPGVLRGVGVSGDGGLEGGTAQAEGPQSCEKFLAPFPHSPNPGGLDS